MLITDRHRARGEDALVNAVSEAIAGGVNAVELRERDLPVDKLLPLARRMFEITRNRATLIVNGQFQVALAARTDGVHLPEASPMPERPARPFLIGRSVHSLESAEVAWAECADYVIAGPVFRTASHPNAAPAGVRLIESITRTVAIPVLAVGGITPKRVPEVMRAGATGVATISAILIAASPRIAAQQLKNALANEWSLVDEVH